MRNIQETVSSVYTPKRIDVYLTGALGGQFSREEIKNALQKGKILLNGETAKPRTLVKEGDLIEGAISSVKDSPLSPETLPIRIVYEDDWLLVVDKAAGMVVHPGAGHKKGTLVHALLGKGVALSSVGDKTRPGIVHRLDKETSGLLLVAKNNQAHRLLQAQFASRSLSKTYTALVKGRVEFEEGRICEPIGRDRKIRQKMAVVKDERGREAETHYRVLKRFPHATLLEIKLLTGRTHQIRVHFAHLGCPVVGDAMYGRESAGRRLSRRHALHASKISFTHPKTGKIMEFESPLPDDFDQMIEEAKKGFSDKP